MKRGHRSLDLNRNTMLFTRSTVSAKVKAPIDQTFITIAPIHLPLIFTGYGPLPAVTETRDQIGDWNAPGQTRTVLLADSSTLKERLNIYIRPTTFAYTVANFTGVLNFLVESAEGEWHFTQTGHWTQIKWIYEFKPKSILVWPLVVMMAKLLWQGCMNKALNLAIDHIQKSEG